MILYTLKKALQDIWFSWAYIFSIQSNQDMPKAKCYNFTGTQVPTFSTLIKEGILVCF